jgi:hypothetical protein
MIIFMSQAPILVAVLLMLLLIALFELIGLKTRYNIAVLAAVSLLCLVAAALERNGDPVLPAILYAIGVSLAMLLALYALATARRGRQRMWFAGLLIVAILTLGAVIVIHTAMGAQDAEGAAIMTYALTVVPAISALMYGLFAPDIPKPKGGV